ncbi:hypothetical protein AgCh_020308 [Apium graveolens]
MRGNAFSDSSKENQNPLILSGTKPQPFNQSMRTNNAEYLSRNPLKIINGNSASLSPLTELSKNIEFSQNLQSADSRKENQSPIIPSSISSLSRSSIEHSHVSVVGNYQSSDKDRLATGQMLMSTLHEVQVDINFQPSFEKLGDCDDVDVHDFDNAVTKWSEYLDVDDPDRICSNCQAIMWNHERNNKKATKKPPTFSLCCKNGQIILEKERQPPEPLASLLTGGSHFRHFKEKY